MIQSVKPCAIDLNPISLSVQRLMLVPIKKSTIVSVLLAICVMIGAMVENAGIWLLRKTKSAKNKMK